MKLDNFMLESTVQLSKIISSQIAKVKIYVLYAGKNRNHTHFSKAMIEEKLIPSMYGMPIIGEYIKEKEDFGGHGGKTTITESGIEYEPTTVAYGFIPESSQMRWESVKELNGTYRDYLVCDAYVWYKRFPELETLLEEPRNQSMEIDIKDAYWNEGLQAYDITDAELTGCCVLGLTTEPCFESAKIGRFSLEKMKYDLAEMAQELKEVIKSEVKTEVKEFENMETEEMTKVEETEVKDTVTEIQEEEVVEETEEKVKEEAAEEPETQEEEEVVEEVSEEAETEVEEPQEETVEEEPAAEEPEATEEVEEVKEEAEEETETAEEFSKEQIEAMQQELEELRAFKAAQEKTQKEQIMESFKNELTEEDLVSVKENLDSLTTDEVETQCFALLGKKKMNFSVAQPTVNKEVVAIGSNFAQEDNTLPAWARAIQKHTSKRQ